MFVLRFCLRIRETVLSGRCNQWVNLKGLSAS